VFSFSGAAVPSGYLGVPMTQTLVSVATYPALFAAIGYAWGGSGASFGLPYLAYGHVPVQGSLGAHTPGSVIAHTHTQPVGSGASSGAAGTGTYLINGNGNTGSTGGPNNLAAGMGFGFIVKF
jgi:microcystin-dependent protein